MNTLSAAWALALKDLRSFLRDRTALVLSILVPIALVSVFGWIMAYAFGGSGGMPQVRLHVADFAASASSRDFIQSLESSDMISVRKVVLQSDSNTQGGEQDSESYAGLEKLIRDGDAHHVLVIPSSYDEQIEAEATPVLKMLRDPGRVMEDRVIQIAVIQASMSTFGGTVFTDAMDRVLTDQGMDSRSVGTIRNWMTNIGSTIETFYEDQDEPNDAVADGMTEGSSQLAPELEPSSSETEDADSANDDTMQSMMAFMDEMLPMDTTDVAPPDRGKQVTYQQAQSVAGMTVMMLLFALTSCGSVLLTEREEGTLKRLFAQPVPRNSVLLGKFLFVLMVGLGQMGILFSYGEWMFQVGLFRDPLSLLVLSVSWVVAGGAFGMFLASVSRSAKQAESLASLLILVMAALGGCWFPLQMMSLPPLMDAVCKSTMTYWAMTGFQSMLWNNLQWNNDRVLTALYWQWGWAFVLTLAAIFFFRRNYCRG